MTTFVRLAIAFEGGLFLLAVGLGWVVGVSPIGLMQPTWVGSVSGVVATLPLLVLMYWCTKSSIAPIQQLMKQVRELLVPVFRDAAPHHLLLISILAGLGEECLFRGVIHTMIEGWLGFPVALAVTSTLFGLAHLITPTYALLAGLIGVYFSLLAVATDSLIGPILTHALYDYLALSYLVRLERDREDE